MIISVEEARLDSRGELRVLGWAAGVARVASVEIVVAGVRLGEADYGRSRPDVFADHPLFVGAAHSGFAFTAMLDELQRRAEQVFVIVRAEGLPPQAAARTLARVETPAAASPAEEMLRFHCDTLALFDDGVVQVSGWAAHINEVERIEVKLDGVEIGEAQFGQVRPDVGKSLPEIPSATRSGFEFTATLDDMAAGEHELDLVVCTRRGDRLVRELRASTQIARDPRIAAERRDIRMYIDSPTVEDGALVEPIGRQLAIEGWAIARHGVASIEAFLDGALVTTASRGIRRQDIGAAYPEWPDSLMSGFAIILPRKVFSKEKHVLRLAVRDRRGEVKELEIRVAVQPIDAEEAGAQLRTFVPQAEVDLKHALIGAAAARPFFALIVAPGASPDGLQQTLETLRAQVFTRFRVGFLAPSRAAGAQASAMAENIGLALRVFGAASETGLADAVEALAKEEGSRAFFLCLRAGDRLGADALLEFALEIVTRPEEDFHYADDRRSDSARGKTIEFLKPEWSPDLLLSTNYIGRAWCASIELARRVGFPLAHLRLAGHYDLVLRLTEAAHEIGRAPLVLIETERPSDDPDREMAALRAAMARRGIEGGVRPTDAPGVYRLRRRVRARGLVSIIIPTIARGGFIEKCLDSLRRRTLYNRFEVVVVDNIKEPYSSAKDWLKRHADCVVEYPGPFNWSQLNNLGAAAALGEFLLFLNDDIEAIDSRWLHALMEHAERPEVGIVGPRLLYPDGRVQHAGMFLSDANARHAFRFAEADDFGDFGIGAAQRNVAAVTGACMLMRRSAFNELGGFDETHPIVNNDVDMCLRAWRAGLRVVYTPHAALVHHEMASRSELKDAFDEKGFDAAWRNTFALGDPFFHPRLLRDEYDYAPDPEPTRVVVAGRPLLARETVRRILVQKLDHVGDFITGLPAIRRLKQRFPEAEIHVLAPSASVALARLEPAIADVIEFNFFHFVSQQGRREIGEADWAALEARLKPYRFDIAIDLRKHTETRDILKRSGARMTAGFDLRGAYSWLDVALEWDSDQAFLPKRSHVAEDYVALVEAVSLACESERGFIAAPRVDEAIARTRAPPTFAELRPGLFERPVVGVHPASGNVLRQWPAEHFAQLIDLVVDVFDVNVALLGAPNEAVVAEAVLEASRAPHRIWSLVGRTSLDELPTVLRSLRLFIGNNSGPHHLAAALGTPTIGVHSGVVSAREWGPLGPMAAAIQRDMSCGPCYLDKPSGCARGLACLQGLRPADVFRVCEQMLGAELRFARA